MTPQILPIEPGPDARRDALAERLLGSLAGAFDLFAVYLGDRLGLYRVLADDGPMTSAELAERTGTDERYVREWLEQQATSGLLTVVDASRSPEERRFDLPAGHDEVLADPESLDFLAPMAQVFVGAVKPLDRLVHVFRHGGGIPFEDYGDDMRDGQARVNRASFLKLIGREWIPAMPGVHDRLTSGPARVADIGCGGGWSSIGIAQAYPAVRVDAYDLDEASVGLARSNVRRYGLEDRIGVEHRDAGDPTLSGRYELVTAFECLHDMSDPVSALRTMRRLVKDDGAVLVVDERVSESFEAPGDVDAIMYGWSILHCLPVGRSDSPSTCTGTVMRPDTLRAFAREAGFRDVEVLDVENLFFRFYRLIP